ncbi:DUF5615 family PIN-like protein [Hymenobacter sp. J193]|uniref:DUF5615 family PIN-like protein n=1 Tax=Hymenobacter sp. J193 TaxID=2898429 RepID=UPI002151DD38|nr:DUF5615 family PIN-like protein [Hymenobacter sp. J193]MCR5887625.1 DUF5615 family PIN-like protein [Hymenobacter sp. J193]
MAAWLRWKFAVDAWPLRELGLRDADDDVIFKAAKTASVTIITKDADFRSLLEQLGPPPQILWLTCGNTSNNCRKFF